MTLGNIAFVRSGLVLSRKLSRKRSPYCYPLLNLRAIHPDGYILSDDLEVFHAIEPLSREYLTQQGDIIIRLSIPYTAILIDATRIPSLAFEHAGHQEKNLREQVQQYAQCCKAYFFC